MGATRNKTNEYWPVKTISTGRLYDDISLALAYAAADVVMVPSRLDNLPQTATEAIACGTPVVGFEQGGMSDVIEHQKTGWLAKPFDVKDLVHGIVWALTRPSDAPVTSLYLQGVIWN